MSKNTTMNNATVDAAIDSFERWANDHDLDEYEIRKEIKRVFPGIKFLGTNYGNLYNSNGYTQSYIAVIINREMYFLHFYEYSECYDKYSDEYLYR